MLSAAELVGASNSDAPVAAPTERVGVVLKLGEVGFATITRKVHLAQTLARAIKPRQTGDSGQPQQHPPRADVTSHVHSLRGRAGCIQTWLQMRQRRVENRTRPAEANGHK